MVELRSVVLAASVGLLLVSASCLPTYSWEGNGGGDEDGATPSGEGGSGGSTTTPQSFACPSAPALSATNGPFGAEQLYFGQPEIDQSLIGPIADRGGSVSPDGLRFIQGWTSLHVRETPRLDIFSSWGEEPYEADYTFYELHPRLSGDNRTLYSCHGGDQECMLHTRSSTGPGVEFIEVIHFQDLPPFDGPGSDYAFTPTPNGQFLAFGSNRVSVEDDSDGADDLDLWIATADPADPFTPPRSYMGLEKLTASVSGVQEEPSWLSDSGRTLIFYRRYSDDEKDLFIVDRPDTASPFGAEIKLPFSQPGVAEQEMTMPSMATLQTTGCGFAYYEVTAPAALRAWMRVPVCVGAPCEP